MQPGGDAIVAQQAVNQTVTTRRGLANGYVVSLYPLGAMLGAPAFGWFMDHGRPAGVFYGAAVVLLMSVLAAVLIGPQVQRSLASRGG